MINKKPKQIIDFGGIINQHPKDEYTAVDLRKGIKKRIDNFISSDNSNDKFLFIIGELGIGKTALLANYVYDRRDEIIHYFFQRGKSKINKPKAFLEHLYYSLNWIYGPCHNEINNEDSDLITLLNESIREVCDNHKDNNLPLFIDAIDEAETGAQNSIDRSIIEIINQLDFGNRWRIVISSSKRILGLDSYEKANDENLIILSSTIRGNQEDLEEYLTKEIWIDEDESIKVPEIAKRCSANFKYAKHLLRISMENNFNLLDSVNPSQEQLSSSEWNKKISQLIVSILSRNSPEEIELGNFFGEISTPYFDNIIESIRKEIENDDMAEYIWHALCIIAISWEPLETEVILDIVGVDKIKKNTIMKHLEPYLNMGLYLEENSLCKISIYELERRAISNKWMPVSKMRYYVVLIVEYIERKIKEGYLHELTFNLIENGIFYYPRFVQLNKGSYEPPKREIEIITNTAFYKNLYKHPLIEHDNLLNSFLTNVFSLSLGGEIGHFIILHYLYTMAYLSYQYQEIGLISRVFSDKKHPNKLEYILRLADGDPELIAKTAIEYYLSNKLSANDMQSALSTSFSIIKDDFKDINKAYTVSKNYADMWFPLEDNQISRSTNLYKESTGTISPPSRYVVYENWNKPKEFSHEHELNEFIEDKKPKDYDIWIEEPGGLYYHFGEKVKLPKGRLGRFLKILLSNANEDSIPLREFFKALWPKESKISNTSIINKKDDIRKAFSECGTLFGRRLIGEWLYDDPYPRLIIDKNFNYCLIYPTKDKIE